MIGNKKGIKKAQAYWIDYTIALFLFLAMLSLFLVSLNNLDSGAGVGDLEQKADSVSNTLFSQGLPVRWKHNNFYKIGFMEGERMSKLRIYEFDMLPYYKQKNSLGMSYDFSVIFTNASNVIQNLGNLCSLGMKLDIPKNNRMAYYGKGQDFVRANMTWFNATIYNTTEIINALENYTMVILNNPEFAGNFNETKVALENFVKRGNTLILAGYFGGNAFNVSFYATSGRNASFTKNVDGMDVTNETFNISYNYAVNGSVKPFAMDNRTIVFAKWRFGDGDVYFISNFSISKKDEIIKFIRYNIKGLCGNFNSDKIHAKNLIRIKRLAIVGEKIMTMNVYVWTK